jgi:hypothetical protein
MQEKQLTRSELEQLRQLKVVRADSNDLYVRLLDTYLQMILKVEDLESENHHLVITTDDYKKAHDDAQDELLYVRSEFNRVDSQNRNLVRSLSRFVKDLDREGLITRNETDGKYDASI